MNFKTTDKSITSSYAAQVTNSSAPGRFPLLARLTASSKLFNCQKSKQKLEVDSKRGVRIEKERALNTWPLTKGTMVASFTVASNTWPRLFIA